MEQIIYKSFIATDTLTNKTITSFIGGSSAVITTPSNTGSISISKSNSNK